MGRGTVISLKKCPACGQKNVIAQWVGAMVGGAQVYSHCGVLLMQPPQEVPS